jgi:oligoendopeptidase F
VADAEKIVLDAYRGFAPEMASIAKRFFDGRWIDAPVREGKSPARSRIRRAVGASLHSDELPGQGARCHDAGARARPRRAPGAGGAQGPLLAPTPLTLAETASVFGEMLTFKSLIKATTDAREKKAMLAQKVEDMLNTVARQIAFYSFERMLHEERKAGELTSERVGQIWLQVQSESLGRRSSCSRATRPSGATCPTSSIRRSMSTPTRSATAW